MPGLTAASISENPLHKETITQQSSAGRVFKGLGVAKRGHLAKRKESYAKGCRWHQSRHSIAVLLCINYSIRLLGTKKEIPVN